MRGGAPGRLTCNLRARRSSSGVEGRRLEAPERPRTGALLIAFVVGMTGTWTLFSLQEAVPTEPGEPLLLAWLRLAAEHPQRTAVALTALTWALRPGPPPPLGPGNGGLKELSSGSP
jgi:hypothetical protein